MSLNRRVERLEEATLLPGPVGKASNAGGVVIYTGRDEQGRAIPKDEASRAAMARPGVHFYLPDNGR